MPSGFVWILRNMFRGRPYNHMTITLLEHNVVNKRCIRPGPVHTATSGKSIESSIQEIRLYRYLYIHISINFGQEGLNSQVALLAGYGRHQAAQNILTVGGSVADSWGPFHVHREEVLSDEANQVSRSAVQEQKNHYSSKKISLGRKINVEPFRTLNAASSLTSLLAYSAQPEGCRELSL